MEVTPPKFSVCFKTIFGSLQNWYHYRNEIRYSDSFGDRKKVIDMPAK